MKGETRELHLENPDLLSCEAAVRDIGPEAAQETEKELLVLDATTFYPQGGGQPCDIGEIRGEAGRFIVESVRSVDGQIRHLGRHEGAPFRPGELVRCVVAPERRLLHTRIHSAGHILDIAVRELGLPWTPGKGYHFPEGPYIEYVGTLREEDRERTRAAIEARANAVVGEGRARRIAFHTAGDLPELLSGPPAHIPDGEAIRVVFFGEVGDACRGTHVPDTSKIGQIVIRKIKPEKGRVRVAYAV